MSNTTEVFIKTQSTQAQITAAGINVLLINNNVTETIIGMLGTAGIKGADGSNGVDGVPGSKGDAGNDGQDGAGLSTGGLTGQMLVKKSNTDHDVDWVPNNHIDPTTGRIFLGANDTSGSTTTAADKLNITGGNIVLDTGFAIKRNSGFGYSLDQIVIGGGPYAGVAMKSMELKALSSGVKTALWLNGSNTNVDDSIFMINRDGNKPSVQMTPSGKLRLGSSK